MSRQLVEQKTSLLKCVKDCLEDGASSQLPGLKTNTEDKMRGLFELLSSKFEVIYIVLDALDEFSPHLHLREQLLAALYDMLARLAHKTRLRLCVSSRIDQEAQKVLRPCSCLSIRPDSETIRAFIIAKIRQSPNLSRRTSENQQLYRQIIDDVKRRSDQMYVLAQTPASQD